jgi:hypothetical protein
MSRSGRLDLPKQRREEEMITIYLKEDHFNGIEKVKELMEHECLYNCNIGDSDYQILKSETDCDYLDGDQLDEYAGVALLKKIELLFNQMYETCFNEEEL